MPVEINLIIQLCLLLSYAQNQKALLLLLGDLMALSSFSVDMYLSSFPATAVSLKTDVHHVGYSSTSYSADVRVRQLLFGITIDHFGREKPLVIGIKINHFRQSNNPEITGRVTNKQ